MTGWKGGTDEPQTFEQMKAARDEALSKLAKYEALHEKWRNSDDPLHQLVAGHIDYVFTGDPAP
jgi:hypothetical protein